MKWVYFLLLFILIISACKNNSTISGNDGELPNSFTIQINGDYTSSGTDRIFNSELTFTNGKLTEGWKRSQNNYYIWNCKFDKSSAKWVVDRTFNISSNTYIEINDECQIEDVNFLTVSEVQGAIDSGKIKPLDEDGCKFRETCYQIIKSK